MSNSFQSLITKAHQLRQRVRKLVNDPTDGVWRTVRGRRIFIRNGENLLSALKRSASGEFDRGTPLLTETVEMYHGTSSELIASIKKNGFVAGVAKGADTWAKQHNLRVSGADIGDRRASVFFTTKKSNAISYANAVAETSGGTPVVIKLRFPAAMASKFLVDERSPVNTSTGEVHGFRFRGVVSPEYIVDARPVDIAYKDRKFVQDSSYTYAVIMCKASL